MAATNLAPKAQLDGFIDKYLPDVAAQGRAVLAKVRRIMPGAVQMVYDNYQWLVVGFGATERPSEAVMSVVFAPTHITICFLQNASTLPDPDKLLGGSGKQVRSIKLASPKDVDRPAVRALIDAAIQRTAIPFAPTGRGALIIRSISAKQRPRRPVEKKARAATPTPKARSSGRRAPHAAPG